MRYEYKVVPAPRKGQRARGIKGSEARFAHALQSLMNDLATEGWEYLRADTLPSEERQGLRGRSMTYQNLLIFRRQRGPAARALSEEMPSGAEIRPVPSMRRVEPEEAPRNAPTDAPAQSQEPAPAAPEAAPGEGTVTSLPLLTRSGQKSSPGLTATRAPEKGDPES